ncbi:MAG: hypothetical protein R3C56_04290 [Pirellulaceae bacterium]
MATVKQTTTPDTQPDDNCGRLSMSPSAPTTIDLLAESDKKVRALTDNTNAQTLDLCQARPQRMVVEVLAGGNVAGTATATATTTNVTVNNVASCKARFCSLRGVPASAELQQ